jgi:hypothetical protein
MAVAVDKVAVVKVAVDKVAVVRVDSKAAVAAVKKVAVVRADNKAAGKVVSEVVHTAPIAGRSCAYRSNPHEATV